MTKIEKLAIGSIALGFLVLGLKTAAWLVTDSVALYSDALESIVNVAAAFAALAAVRLAGKPADKAHPFGHSKAEYLSAVMEGAMIIVAAVLILREAWAGFWNPHPIAAPALGLGINLGASALNGIWGWVLIREGRRARSPALIADGKHLLADVASSAGVAFGVVLALATGWHVLDPILAGLVALSILWSGWGLVKASVGGLMDQAVDAPTLEAIKRMIEAGGEGALQAHDIRTRMAGRLIFIDFHLVVSGAMSVREAHDICDAIESRLRQAFPDAQATIHVEPDHKAKASDVLTF